MFRRRFVRGVAGSAVAGLTAGCVGDENDRAAGSGGTEPAPGTTATGSRTATEGSRATATDERTATSETLDVEGTVADGGGLRVTAHELYRSDGAVGLRGTVENAGESTYGYVEAEVTLRDDRGDVLYEFADEDDEGRAVTLDPGGVWQFDAVLRGVDDVGAVSEYTVTPGGATGDALTDDASTTATVYGDVDERDPNLEVVSHRLSGKRAALTCGCENPRASGTIENVGAEAIESVTVSVALYGVDGTELGVFDTTVGEGDDAEDLPPGESWTFRVGVENVDVRTVIRYVVRADGTSV